MPPFALSDITCQQHDLIYRHYRQSDTPIAYVMTPIGPYEVYIKEHQACLGFNLHFRSRNGERHDFALFIRGLNFSSQMTAYQTAALQMRNDIIINGVLYEFCHRLNINPTEQLSDDFRRAIISLFEQYARGLSIQHARQIVEDNLIARQKKPEKKLDEDVQEALNIQNEAMKIQKEIIEKTEYIKKRRNDYYKKYGTFFDKILAYLKS